MYPEESKSATVTLEIPRQLANLESLAGIVRDKARYLHSRFCQILPPDDTPQIANDDNVKEDMKNPTSEIAIRIELACKDLASAIYAIDKLVELAEV